jgi:negative regulator of flagellin synthesis FlgM
MRQEAEMKITHNKVGQNLNLTDDIKSGKSESSRKSNASENSIGSSLLEPDASKVELSPRAQEAKRIKDLAMAAPDVNQENVERLRKLIDDGKYKVDAQAVADRMVDEHLETAE